MKYLKIFSITAFAVFVTTSAFAQTETKKLGFYFQPEYSAMFLENHIGNAVGFNLGIISKNKKWEVGIRYYGRSGPINLHQEYDLVLAPGTDYKGKSVVKLGADHGYLGLEAAFVHPISDRVLLRFPVSIGQLGAGFYLKGEDRITPDGRRVSEWEDELQGSEDAGFGFASEIGSQIFYQPFKKHVNLLIGTGIHFTNTYGYSSFVGGDNFYNNKLRASFGLRLQF